MSALLEKLENQSEVSASWNAQPFQIVTLLDMLPFEAYLLVFATDLFNGSRCKLQLARESRGGDSQITEQEIKSLHVRLGILRTNALTLDLQRTLEVIGDIENETAYPDMAPSLDVMLRDLEGLERAISRDLKANVYLALSADDVKYYQQEQLFGPEVFTNFHSARNDVAEAGNCYATGRHTACVFHCMRVVEKGLHAFVNELNDKHKAGITFRDKVEFENWGNIITEIQLALENPKRIKRLEPLPTKEEMTFYSKVAIEVEYFKNAWRDDVAHARSQYDEPGARSVMDHVKAFMTYVARQGLTEIPEEIDNPLPEN